MQSLSETGKKALARVRAINDHVDRNFVYKTPKDLAALLKERDENEKIYRRELRRNA